MTPDLCLPILLALGTSRRSTQPLYYSSEVIDTSDIDDDASDENLIGEILDDNESDESDELMELDTTYSHHVNHHLQNNELDRAVGKVSNYPNLNSYYKNHINSYLKQYEVRPSLAYRFPANNIRHRKKIRHHISNNVYNNYPPVKLNHIVAQKGKPYAYSYSDGHGTNFNVNVHRRMFYPLVKENLDNNQLNNDFDTNILQAIEDQN
ncbi:uncharacterized protein LOC130669820 [Microplitis mediator]|uniref:uncharacterized protein LOC130669820 n=1 Tax=Microplitis mediator TaxID=375433 RepID=UPI0025561FAD|nr:uncharacterized protein LOC130669820 [Microplitis mediator]